MRIVLGSQACTDTYKVVDAIVDALKSQRPQARYVLGFDAKLYNLISLLPTSIGDRLLPKFLWAKSNSSSHLHDVTAAILVFLNDEMAVMLMFQASLVEIKLSCKLFLLFSWIYINRCRLREWKRSTGIPKHSLRSKCLAKKDRGTTRSFGRAKNGTRAKKWTKGEGESFLPLIPTPSLLFYSPHFSRGLWLLFLVLCPETARKLLLCRLLPKTMKWWPCWYPTPILWELNHFLM